MHRAAPRPPRDILVFVQFLLGLTVGVVVMLAEWLGTVRVPPFAPILDLVPPTIRGNVIPISGAVASIVATSVQWGGNRRFSGESLARAFGITFLAVILALSSFVWVHAWMVRRVEVDGGAATLSVLVGPGHRLTPPQCSCPPGLSDTPCLRQISLRPDLVEQCWGTKSVLQGELWFQLTYNALIGSLAALVGVAFLDRSRRQRSRAS